MATTINANQASGRSLPIKEWASEKNKSLTHWLNTESKFFNKSFLQKIWTLQNFFISLQRQNFKSGTSAASSHWLFLYPQTSESNTAAPRRVSGNAPGSPAFETLTTRSAASLCQKSKVMATTINANQASGRSLPIKEWASKKNKSLTRWLNTESKFFNKSFLQKIWTLQNFFISLQRQNHKSGTDAADQCRQFLYPHISENNITAPCRVMETPRKPCFYELRQHVAQFLFSLNHKVMATTINANQASGRSLPIKEWASKKNKSLTLWLNTETKFFTSLCNVPVTRLLAIQTHLLFLCLITGASTIEKQPLAAAISAICAAYLACRINKKEGGKA